MEQMGKKPASPSRSVTKLQTKSPKAEELDKSFRDAAQSSAGAGNRVRPRLGRKVSKMAELEQAAVAMAESLELEAYKLDVSMELKLATEITGDLNLICKEGAKVPAHSAVLASFPYFEAKLKEDWSGPGWNLNKKLDLHLPCAVNKEVIQAFLKYAFGDVWSLTQLESSDATILQDLFSLGEACGLPTLCSAISEQLLVTAPSASSWLEWLSQEHGYDVSKIREKVKQAVKKRFRTDDLWDGLTVEQLQSLEEVAKKLKPA
ncbi:hypothetical protein KFL_003980030 [Klebsormidium nitens]|uniref:BTB domain-containing protein n=1 Tax=Klebsormidium nitens TaxID=105231 RepID=A0A1Y1IIR3_KLENI|nr:hypothetical protein KFL_003980030 [Klebsormidium nitens]|eukprot:GAQ88068.1 hypothetical protein KFL_003980030 [Klebsormidium nitens]